MRESEPLPPPRSLVFVQVGLVELVAVSVLALRHGDNALALTLIGLQGLPVCSSAISTCLEPELVVVQVVWWWFLASKLEAEGVHLAEDYAEVEQPVDV